MQMKYFELIKPGTNHDFVKYRRVAVTASLVVNALILFGAVAWPKLNYGVDFAGEPSCSSSSTSRSMRRMSATR